MMLCVEQDNGSAPPDAVAFAIRNDLAGAISTRIHRIDANREVWEFDARPVAVVPVRQILTVVLANGNRLPLAKYRPGQEVTLLSARNDRNERKTLVHISKGGK